MKALDVAAVNTLAAIDASDRLFAERLLVVRQARGWNAVPLSQRLGQHVQFIASIESRRARRVSVGEGLAICTVLDVDLAQMLDPDVPVETLLGGAE